MTQVFLAIQMGFSLRIPDIGDSDPCRHGLKFAVSVHFTGQAIQGVISKHQLNDILTQALNVLRISVNILTFGNRCVTGRKGFRRAILL